MVTPLHPLISSPDEQENSFAGLDPTVIDFPDKTSPLEDAYHQTVDLTPEHAAAVIKTTRQVNQPPEFVAENLEAAQKAAAIPPSEYFAAVTKRYPQTAAYLSDPKYMAVGKDDLPSLTQTEDLIRQYGTTQTMGRALVAGMAHLNATVAGIPNLVESYAALLPNLAMKAAGHPESQITPNFPGSEEAMRYWSSMAANYSPDINQKSVSDVLKTGNIPLISKTLTSKLIEGAPSLAVLIGASMLAGPEAGAGLAGVSSASDILSRNTQIGLDPADAAINSMYHGAINAAFMNLGALSPLHKWESAIAESVGVDTARKVVLDMAKTIAASAASFAGTMGALSIGTSAIDATTGAVPGAMQGAGKRALDAAIEGGVTGAAMVGPSAILGGFVRGEEVQRSQQAKDFYLALGDSAQSSKLRERLPDAHRELIEQITKDGPVDSIYTPINDFEAYFQSQKMDPRRVAQELGVGVQYDQAKAVGADLQIPLAEWTDKIVGTPHFKGLADDVKFFQDELTPRQAAQHEEMVGKLTQMEFDLAVKENPKLQESRNSIYNDVREKLLAAGRPPKEAAAAAQIWAARTVVESGKRGITPEELYTGEPINISKQKPDQTQMAQSSGGIFKQESPNDLPIISEQAKTGEPHAVFAYNWKLDADHPSIPYFRLYGDPEKINEMTKMPNNPGGNTWRSDVSLDTVKAAGIEIRGKSPDARDQPLFQDPTDPRGFIQFTPKETVIGLIKADASTFMHESAHFWLKDMFDYVQSGRADEKYMADWNTLGKWLKMDEGQKDLTRDQHEQFARGFEAYLREGKAPSEGLRRPFSLFRKWLTRLYKDPSMLNVQMSDDVRGVMDRMFASEEEITFAEQHAGFDLSKDLGDLDPAVKAKMQDLADAAHEKAVSTLLAKQMDEMSAERKATLLNEAITARTAAEKAVKDSPIKTAMRAVENTFGKDPLKVAQDYWLKKLTPEKRSQMDQLAESRGFSCGDELAKKIIDELPAEQQISDRVAQHMARFADLRHTNQIKDEAMKAIHNDKMAELMAFERAVFQKMVEDASGKAVVKRSLDTEARLEAAAAKFKAKEIIDGKSVKEAGSYLPFFTAERNAAINVAKALIDKDYAKAADFKRQQMLNHALVSEAYNRHEEIEKGLRLADRFATRNKDLKNIPYGFVRQIDKLLSDHGLADPRTEDAQTYLAIAKDMATQGEDSSEIAHATGWIQDESGEWKQESLSDTVSRIQNDYRNIAISPDLMDAKPTDYRRMPMARFRDLIAAVKAINAVGRGYDRFLDENIKMDRKEAAAKFRQFVEANVGTRYRESRMEGSKVGENKLTRAIDAVTHLPDSIAPNLVNLYSFCDFLDAGDPNGLAKQLIYRPLKHGEDAKIRMSDKAVGEMKAIVEKHWPDGGYEKLRDEKVYIKSRDREYTRDQLQAIANNWGTDTGRDRITKGFGYTPEQTQEVLSNITKQQWDFAQALWDYNDKYWPEIVALQQRVAGETPDRVTPAPVQTPFGDYRGGYYHISYDRSKSNEAFQNIDARNALYKTGSAAVAHTSHGFTESRVQTYSQPVNLDSRVEFTHIEDLIHDLNYRKPIIDVNAFFRQKDTREAIINAIGRDGFDAMQQHLKWVAADQGEYLNGLTDNFIQRLRFGSTIATLGLRPITAPIFLSSNAISAIKDLGPMGFGNAIKDFLSDRDANVQKVDALSARMTKRSTLRDRDLKDMDASLRGNARLMAHFMFFPHQKADQAITYPLWLHVYKNSIGEHGQQMAVDLADEAVTNLAGSGSVVDQAMIQRGSETKKIFSWWYSWAGTQFNRAWRDGKMAGLEYDKGNIGAALTILGTSAFFGWGLQGANEALWRELFRNSQNQDDDKRDKRVGMRMAMQGVGYIPVVREIAQYGLEKTMGSQADLKLPFQASFEALTDPFFEWAKERYTGKESPHFWEDTAKSAAILAKYPQYLNTLAFNFLDYVNDKGDFTWRDLFARRTNN